MRGRVAAGDDPQAEKRAGREAVRRRRMGETVSGALASWLKDEKLGPLGLRHEPRRAPASGLPQADPVSASWPPVERLAAVNGQRAKQRNAVLPDDVNIHDIRRTVADGLLNRIGAPPWIVDHVVHGHARPKLLRTYMPTLPLGEARDALQKWGEEIDKVLRADLGASADCQMLDSLQPL